MKEKDPIKALEILRDWNKLCSDSLCINKLSINS